MKFLVISVILLGFVGTAFGQYLGDKIPPGTMDDKQSDSFIFPKDYLDFYYSDKFQQYSLISGSYQYDVPYKINNGNLTKMSIDCNSVELVLEIEVTGDQGLITVALPRYLIDAKLGNKSDDTFIVLQDSHEIQFTELDVIDAKLRILLIPFSSDASKIRIIGTNYPEALGENACNGKHEPPLSYLISPLKQFKSGIPSNEIQCKEGLELILRSAGGSPACVKPETKQILVERGWTKTVTTPESIPTFNYEIKTGGVTYGSQYQITGGTVDEITYDANSNSLIISLNAPEKGYIQIVLPSGLLSPPNKEGTADYLVIQDGKEVDFEQLSPILLKISFEKDTKQILIERDLSQEKPERESLTLKEEQSWGYIKSISILNENYVNVEMSYPTNEVSHEMYPDEYQSIIGGCSMQDGSSTLSLLYLKEINPEQNQVKFRKETKVFDGLQCDDAFWEEMTTRGYCGPPDQLITRTEQIVPSIDEAKVNFTLDVPRYLPEGYVIQKITVEPDGTSAMLYASQKPVTNEMDSCEFMWGDKGIFLYYVKTTEDYEWEKRYQEYSKETIERLVTINDRIMSVEDHLVGDRFGMPIPQASNVLVYRYEDSVHISIRSSLAADELIEIAKSFFAS